jgi:hypothetical protein
VHKANIIFNKIRILDKGKKICFYYMSAIDCQSFLCWIRTVQRIQQEIRTVQPNWQEIRNRDILHNQDRKGYTKAGYKTG